MIYIIFFFVLIIGACLPQKSFTRGYWGVIMCMLFAIIGFRGLDVGADTPSYVEDFNSLRLKDYAELSHILRYSKEPLYTFLTWLMGNISTSYVFYLASWALFPCLAMYVTLKDELKEPKDYMVTIFCFFALGLFAFFVAGIRQTAAISLLFFGYRYVKNFDFTFRLKSYADVNLLKFALCVFLAYNIHNSSIIFLIALPFLKIKIRWWYLPLVIALFFVGSYVQIGFLVDVAAIFFEDRYGTYGTVYESSQSMNAFIIQFILFLICFFQRDILIEKEKSNIYLFNLVLLGLIFQSFSGLLAEMARVSFYFSIFLLILVPRAMKEYPMRIRLFLYPGFTMALLFYLFYLSGSNLPQYSSSVF